MDQNLKQRLVGALVLLSAAVIFLPLIFDGRKEQETYTDIQIPEEPVVTLDVTEPEVDVTRFEEVKKRIDQERAAIAPSEESLNEPVASLPEVKKPVVAAREDVAQIKQQSEQKTKPQGTDRMAENYTIQLAAFSSKENAEKLHKQLIAKNYKAYIQKGTSGGKTLYRVFVGPQLRKNRAALIADALNKEFKLKGMVVRYAP